jgi:LPXTG-motif cell wall-anchored protein
MKKVYVLVAAAFAAFAALSVGSASFAAGDCHQSYGCEQPDDTVPATDETIPSTEETTTTVGGDTPTPNTQGVPTTASTPTTAAAPIVTDEATTTTAAAAGVTVSTDVVDQGAPTTTVRKASDGLLPNTGSDVAIPLILAGLAAGTGAATLLVRRRSNAS